MKGTEIHCRVNGEPRHFAGPANRRLLDVLREDLGLTGTKEGCGEGECGSCSVLLDGRLVCSCLVPVGQCDGARVTTIEGVAEGGVLDEVQRAFLKCGAVQCGACTPGMVLTAHSLLEAEQRPNAEAIREHGAGTLCRCTGYEGILRAVFEVVRARASAPRQPLGVRQEGVASETRVLGMPGLSFHRPRTLREALAVLTEEELPIVAGCTDMLVQHTASGLPIPALDLTGVDELRGVFLERDELVIGALSTFAELRSDRNVQRHAPILAEAAGTIGATQIQNRATLGGNLVNASPAADSAPPLLALEASVELASSSGTRRVPLDEFFLGYRETARRPGEILTCVRIPLPTPEVQRFRKVGTRAAQAISKVVLALTVRRDPRRVRIGAGSLAPVPRRLRRLERHLEREDWREILGRGDYFVAARLPEPLPKSMRLERAIQAEVQPINDVRSSGYYRWHVTARILTRWLRELASS